MCSSKENEIKLLKQLLSFLFPYGIKASRHYFYNLDDVTILIVIMYCMAYLTVLLL